MVAEIEASTPRQPAWLSEEAKTGVRAARACARDASICHILQGDGDEVSNT
jgi:hypothetical protein